MSDKPKENRERILLRAAFDLLSLQRDSGYVLDLLEQTAFYDDAVCDGNCLMEDIAHELGIESNEKAIPTPEGHRE